MAAPSEKGWDAGQPRACWMCGQPCRITTQALAMERWPVARTAHTVCLDAQRKKAAA